MDTDKHDDDIGSMRHFRNCRIEDRVSGNSITTVCSVCVRNCLTIVWTIFTQTGRHATQSDKMKESRQRKRRLEQERQRRLN